jgi:hypothetical protein
MELASRHPYGAYNNREALRLFKDLSTHVLINIFMYSSFLKMEAGCSSATLLSTCHTTLHHIPTNRHTDIYLPHYSASYSYKSPHCYLPATLHCIIFLQIVTLLSTCHTALHHIPTNRRTTIYLPHYIASYSYKSSHCYLPATLHCIIFLQIATVLSTCHTALHHIPTNRHTTIYLPHCIASYSYKSPHCYLPATLHCILFLQIATDIHLPHYIASYSYKSPHCIASYSYKSPHYYLPATLHCIIFLQIATVLSTCHNALHHIHTNRHTIIYLPHCIASYSYKSPHCIASYSYKSPHYYLPATLHCIIFLQIATLLSTCHTALHHIPTNRHTAIYLPHYIASYSYKSPHYCLPATLHCIIFLQIASFWVTPILSDSFCP